MVKNELGSVFGRLTVVAREGSLNGKAAWRCTCTCSESTVVTGDDLRRGMVKSCGCYRKSGDYSTTHGHHRGRASPTYASWQSMKNRCYDEKSISYKYCGAKGIRVCARWLESFENFLADMGVRPEGTSLDRERTLEDYSPENCRWVDRVGQMNNTTRNRIVTHHGVSKTLQQWCRDLGLPYLKTYYQVVTKGQVFSDYVQSVANNS